MRQFLDGLPEHGVIMCHPGFVDDILVGLDPLTVQREHEHAFLAVKISRACWRPIMSHWANILAGCYPDATRQSCCRIHKFNIGGTTCDTKASYISPAPRRNGEKAMIPQERQLVDDLFDRLSKVESAPRDPDAASAIAQGLRVAPNAVTRWCRRCWFRTSAEACQQPHSGTGSRQRACTKSIRAGFSIRCARRSSDKVSSTARWPNVASSRDSQSPDLE